MPQQPRRGHTGRTPATTRLLRGATRAAGLTLFALATACGGGGPDEVAVNSDPAKISAAPAAGVVAPAKVEVIAGLTGCEADIRIEADELRQGACTTPDGGYLITTFPEEKLKETWLDSASVYGGTYLVGTRWVVSAEPGMLEKFRGKLGGEVRELKGIGPQPGASAS
ncbi:hypothetical protein P1P75_36765 [Streptomyces sp. ID05-39B]|uniref:hypothetical protein n=1 Tax=Streptomyces sp. ID05-39B TaxID=3028664 RepID=UPI0029A52ED3|nr:hypothetical protein [Streptomyces sp. ID05-39B]MDX3531801.1 hypothetical protein [Streptomyces sp. ID05-39B]